jgi:hypothetical protein
MKSALLCNFTQRKITEESKYRNVAPFDALLVEVTEKHSETDNDVCLLLNSKQKLLTTESWTLWIIASLLK